MAATENVPSYEEFEYLKESERFRDLSDRAIDLTIEKRDIEQALKSVKEELEAEFIIAGIPTGKQVDYSDWRLQVVEKRGKLIIDKKALLRALQEAGLDGMALLKKVSKRGATSRYVQLTKPGPVKEVEVDDDDI